MFLVYGNKMYGEGGAVGGADVYVSNIKVFLFYLFCFVLVLKIL